MRHPQRLRERLTRLINKQHRVLTFAQIDAHIDHRCSHLPTTRGRGAPPYLHAMSTRSCVMRDVPSRWELTTCSCVATRAGEATRFSTRPCPPSEPAPSPPTPSRCNPLQSLSTSTRGPYEQILEEVQDPS